MKFKKQIILFLLLCVLVLCIGVITSNHSTRDFQEVDKISVETKDEMNLKSPNLSKYWDNFTFIHIDGEDDWSTVASYEWCRGDGSWDNPYIIENITMDATTSPTGSGIFIENSKNVYFIIRNCTVYNAGSDWYDAGIKLENTCNGTLINNNCSNNGRLGILLASDCDNNTVSGNIANNFGSSTSQDFGILLYRYCDNNTILGNTANNNWVWGIRLEEWCNNNTVSGNIASNVGTTYQDYGMGLYHYSDNNIISGNIANNNTVEGLELRGNCQHNTISENTIENNLQYGIYIWDNCDNNTISGNLIRKNQNFGIYIYDSGCENNFIYQNALIGPQGWHAWDNGTNNYWNSSNIGNYWDNQTSPDSDNNGVVDIPYSWISGTANSEDCFPLAESPIHVGGKIYIDDSGVNAPNWSRTAKLNLWCDGAGSWNDPYVIDCLTIDGGGSGSCITINNSNVYFIVRNCKTYNAGSGTYDAGIKLENTNNGTLTNNNCSNNKRYGICLFNGCENNTISDNIATNNPGGIALHINCNDNMIVNNTANYNGKGIDLNDCDDNRIVNNTANYNGNYGIYLNKCNDTMIVNNTANNNGVFGILLYQNCDNNSISGNTAKNNYCGISLESNCNNNIVEGNTANNNLGWGIHLGGGCNNNTLSGNIANNVGTTNQDFGIHLLNQCDNNTISGNTANNNKLHGIFLDEFCDNNTISGNTANNNTENGILLISWCCENTISGNTANNNKENGIYLNDGAGTTIANNTLNNNSCAIYIKYCINNIISGNMMEGDGIMVSGSEYKCFSSHDIYPNNTVNGRNVYYYVEQDGLGINNFTNAGQVILIRCNNSLISDLNVSQVSIGIFFYDSNGNNITGNIANDNHYYGIYLYLNCDNNTIMNNLANGNGVGIGSDFYCNNNTILGNTANGNGDGISLNVECNYNTIVGNVVNSNENGIYFDKCDENIISRNIVNNNTFNGIYLYSLCDNNNLSGNIVNGNKNCGILLYDACDSNNITENYIYFNTLAALEISSFTCDNNIVKRNVLISTDGMWINDGGTNTILITHYFGTIAPSLFVEIINQSFSTTEFVITIEITSEITHLKLTDLEISDFYILIWWNGIAIPSNNIEELGNGLYNISLNPIFIDSGDDPILLNMTISEPHHGDKYYEIQIAVDPQAVDKTPKPGPSPPSEGDGNGKETETEELAVFIMPLVVTVVVGSVITASIAIYLHRKRILPKREIQNKK